MHDGSDHGQPDQRVVPENFAWPAAHENQDGNGGDENPEQDLISPDLGEFAQAQHHSRGERERRMELGEDLREARENEDDKDRADRNCQHEDDRRVDHGAPQLFQGGVLPLKIGSHLGQYPI